MDADKLLAEAEIGAERTVAYVRMIMALVGGAVFFFEVRGTTLMDSLTPVLPFLLSSFIGYFGIGLVSLILARPNRFRRSMPWVFTTCDLGFWFALIASAVHLLGLPIAYVTIFPPMWIAPIMLALVNLRFNPWLQAYAVAVVGIGLSALFIWAPPVTMSKPIADFEFFLRNALNVPRFAMLLFLGMVLVIVAMRARAILARAISQQIQRTNLTRYLPPQLADHLAETGAEALHGRQQDAAILFVDIRGFTASAETMQPAALSQFLTEYRRAVARAADSWNGVIDKFVGDSAMIVFGMPEPGRHDAANALHCAQAIKDAIGDWNVERERRGSDPVQIGIGAHYGRVFCGAVGDAARLEFTVLGDTVNVAARLEEATKSSGKPLVVSAELLAAAGIDGAALDDWVRLPETTVRGRGGEIQLFGKS